MVLGIRCVFTSFIPKTYHLSHFQNCSPFCDIILTQGGEKQWSID